MQIILNDSLLTYLREFIDTIGVLVIFFGALTSTYGLGRMVFFGQGSLVMVRIHFGESIILGLEFMVGSDIIGSLIDPDYYNLGLLGLIVLIRSVLSYFLSRELHDLKVPETHRMHV